MQNWAKTIAMYGAFFMTLFNPMFFLAEQTDETSLVQGNNAFALDLYRRLRSSSDGNLFFSPHSVSTALAMAYAGARGNTEKEMAKALRFSLDQKRLHPAFADVESKLNKLQESGGVELSVANSLWPQLGYKLLEEYLSLVKTYYGSSITPVDYERAREDARKKINGWVEDKTHDKIKNLIQPGVLDAMTRLVLVNAIYFKGKWGSPFKASLTKDAPFHVASDKSVQAPMMTQQREFGYAETDALQVLELPYAGGGLSMIVLLPRKADELGRIENSLTTESLDRWKRGLGKRKVRIFLPRFKTTSMFRLDKELAAMGMVDAFDVAKADFSGMDGRAHWLYVSAVLHKAFVDVNEEGTEAAAATAAVMAMGLAAPPPVFRADHPFVFLIQENSTGSILFMGRVTDPTNDKL